MKQKPIYEVLGIDQESLIKNSSVYLSFIGIGCICIHDKDGNEEDVFFRDTQDGYERYEPILLDESEALNIIDKMHKYGFRIDRISDYVAYSEEEINDCLKLCDIDKRIEMIRILDIKEYSCGMWDWNKDLNTGFLEFKQSGKFMPTRACFKKSDTGTIELDGYVNYPEAQPTM